MDANVKENNKKQQEQIARGNRSKELEVTGVKSKKQQEQRARGNRSKEQEAIGAKSKR